MRINMPIGSFIASLQELTGIKSGLAVSEAQVIELIELAFPNIEENTVLMHPPEKWWTGHKNKPVVLRGEEFQAYFTQMLYLLGSIPNTFDPSKVLVKRASSIIRIERGRDPTFQEVYHRSMVLQQSIFRDPEFDADEAYMADFNKRNVNRSLPTRLQWDGTLALNDLFDSEVVPEGTTEGHYFDQRYIDYLGGKVGDVSKIHWRQFEYFTAEFFQRIGYEVSVTPPRGDGGVDVVANRSRDELGPELVLVQCKRHSASNLVEIDTVKALWADVREQNANRGLVATTSALEPNARDYCDARKYQLRSAERENVEKWIKRMRSGDLRSRLR